MKALVVHGAGDLRFDDLPAQAPEPGQVLVRNTHGGICGSDLHYYKHGAVGAFSLREPLVLGHEVVGRIEYDPSGALAAGTPVAIHPATPCGHCPECLTGVRNVCRNARYFGSAASFPHTQGGFSEYMIVRQDQIRMLPDTLPLSRAVLAEPLAVGLHALNRAGGVAGAKVLVGGSGPIGTLAAVRRRGVMVQLGMFPPGPRPAELSALVAKEIDYRGAFRFDTEFDESIALLAGSTALDPVITHSFDLVDAVAAMDVSAQPATSGKVVLRLSDD